MLMKLTQSRLKSTMRLFQRCDNFRSFSHVKQTVVISDLRLINSITVIIKYIYNMSFYLSPSKSNVLRDGKYKLVAQ